MTGRVLLLSALLAWYGLVDHDRVYDWTSEFRLWSRAVWISPLYPRARINLAKALYGLGREQDAEVQVAIAADLEYLRGEK